MNVYRKYLLTLAAVWGGCLVLFVAFYLLLISPQQKNRTDIAKQLAEKKMAYENVLKASQQDQQAKLKQDVEQVEERLHDFAVDSENYANLAFDISRIAGDKQLGSFSTKAVEETEQTKNTAAKFVTENRIEIRFEADFIQFATFLNELERHRPVIFVDRFKITRAVENDAGHKVDMDLAISVRKRQEG